MSDKDHKPRKGKRAVTTKESRIPTGDHESVDLPPDPQDRHATKDYVKVDFGPPRMSSCLVVIRGPELGRRFDLVATRPLHIGRQDICDIILDAEEISRRHCKVAAHLKHFVLTDLGSTNGTYINGQRVSARELTDGDLIEVANVTFKYITSANIELAYHDEIYHLSTTDGLTRAHNKRYFMEYLRREVSRCRRQQRSFSLILIDIDHFKRVNDIFGHAAGDSVLIQLTELLAGNIRHEDVLARLGGEEFGIVLPEVDAAGARRCAEKLRILVDEMDYQLQDSVIPITISLGVATTKQQVEDAEALMAAADRRLYLAKQGGRNRCCDATDEPDQEQ